MTGPFSAAGDRAAVIVAHGQPSDPDPAAADLAALARQVAAHLPGWDLRSATLAQDGALDAAVAGLRAPLIYPFFMSDGWFTRTMIPARLTAAGADGARILPPFGLDRAVTALCARILRSAADRAGYDPAETEVLVAVHGSSKSTASQQVAEALVDDLTATLGMAAVTAAYIEQPPRIAEVARRMGARSLCLPFFAARLGHVEGDIPEALAEAGFQGVLLDPMGVHPDVPALIAAALTAALTAQEAAD